MAQAQLEAATPSTSAEEAARPPPTYLSYLGATPHIRTHKVGFTDKPPDPDTFISQFSQPLRSILPLLRDVTSTDQSCDCRRAHVSCTTCFACQREILCPTQCERCNARIKTWLLLFLIDGEDAALKENLTTIHSILYHQSVYLEMAPAAGTTQYPYTRCSADAADLASSHTKWIDAMVSSNATVVYNCVIKCDECGGKHSILRNKVGPRFAVPGVAQFRELQLNKGANTLGDGIFKYERHDTFSLLKCPNPYITVDQAINEANDVYVTEGLGIANYGVYGKHISERALVRPGDYSSIWRKRFPERWMYPGYGMPGKTAQARFPAYDRTRYLAAGDYRNYAWTNEARSEKLEGATPFVQRYAHKQDITIEGIVTNYDQKLSETVFGKYIQERIHYGIFL